MLLRDGKLSFQLFEKRNVQIRGDEIILDKVRELVDQICIICQVEQVASVVVPPMLEVLLYLPFYVDVELLFVIQFL